jgi:hypothetical protein
LRLDARSAAPENIPTMPAARSAASALVLCDAGLALRFWGAVADIFVFQSMRTF